VKNKEAYFAKLTIANCGQSCENIIKAQQLQERFKTVINLGNSELYKEKEDYLKWEGGREGGGG
jgi:hypothetical protein